MLRLRTGLKPREPRLKIGPARVDRLSAPATFPSPEARTRVGSGRGRGRRVNRKERAVMIVNAPVPFEGTEEERVANRMSHCFMSYDPEEPPRCMDCDAATYHVAADYPCGTEPPRVTYGS